MAPCLLLKRRFKVAMRIFHSLPRRVFVGLLIACTLYFDVAADQTTPLRIGLTSVFLDNQPQNTGIWRNYIKEGVGREVVMLQRGSYREIIDLLLSGDLDVAWICGLPYIENKRQLTLISVPLYQGAPLYRSYLIVPKDDTSTQSWTNLPRGVFVFSDPDSNSGSLYPRWAMKQAGINMNTYFRKTFYARGHRHVIESVAAGLADAGSVDGYVWETLNRDYPEITANTRIVEKSETFGFPPIVASNELSDGEIQTLKRVLEKMPEDPEGRRILLQLNLDGFVEAKPTLYENIEDMARALGRID